MEKILIVNVNWLGDAILTTPVFRAIKDKFPSSYVAVMTVERTKDVFTDNPYIDEVIIFDEKKNQKSILEKIKFTKSLKNRNFDTVFLVHRSFTRALICFLAGIKNRIGYYRLKNIAVVNKMIIPPEKSVHRQDYYLYLFERSGIDIKDRTTKVYTNNALKERFLPLINETRKKYAYIAGINPSANWILKRWPPSCFANLCDKLILELNCAIFLIGAQKDADTVNTVIKNMKQTPINLCGQTNIKELAAIMEDMNVFISADSGPAHLAASVGIKTIVLFGPTQETMTSPRGRFVKILRKSNSCEIPCYKLDCVNNVCMKNIRVEDVFLQIKTILENV